MISGASVEDSYGDSVLRLSPRGFGDGLETASVSVSNSPPTSLKPKNEQENLPKMQNKFKSLKPPNLKKGSVLNQENRLYFFS